MQQHRDRHIDGDDGILKTKGKKNKSAYSRKKGGAHLINGADLAHELERRGNVDAAAGDRGGAAKEVQPAVAGALNANH